MSREELVAHLGGRLYHAASGDIWHFVARLKTGELVLFERAESEPGDRFVSLMGAEFLEGGPDLPPTVDTERGLDVALDNIAWVVEASTW